ncbi:UNVERIFIED_ORG: hypothetical protein GGE55_001658 [Rhizobium esperanzae]
MGWKTSDFPIEREKDFRWLGKLASGFPTLWLPDGTLCEPTTIVFGYKLELNLCSIKTMVKELYAIREFFVFLATINIVWEQVDDQVLRRWREFQLEEIESISDYQVERKIAWVFDFYRLLPMAWPLDEQGKLRRLFVGKSNPRKGIFFPITTKTFKSDGAVSIVWSGSEFKTGAAPDFTVPDEKQVGRVLSALRLPNEVDEPNFVSLLATERNWAIGKIKCGAGLRDIEVERATVRHFTEMLRSDGLLNGLPDAYHNLTSIAELSQDAIAQQIIRDSLNNLQRNKRRSYLFLYVKGKKNKERKAYLLINEAKNILSFIWDTRPKILEFIERTLGVQPPDNIFLSLTRRERSEADKAHVLSAGSTGDILAAAFQGAGVEGSGHDLRKFYATSISVRILSETMEVFNFQLTDAVLATILSRVKEALGHAEVDTTVKHYVNLARIHYFALQSKLKREVLNKIWMTLLDRQHDMSDRAVDLCFRFITSLSMMPDDSPVLDAVEKMLAHPRMWPENPDPPPPSSPVLKLVQG